LVKPSADGVWGQAAAQDHLALTLGAFLGIEVRAIRPVALGWMALEAPDLVGDDDTLAAVDALKDCPDVERVAADGIKYLRRVPNDPLLPFMWHVDAMRLPAAWDIGIGSGATRVGVVDSGLIGHEDLGTNTFGAIDFISDLGIANDGDGRDSDGTDACPQDSELHGTHVAGTMVAVGDNGTGIVGANWRAKVIAVRALGCGGTGLTSDINEGALWLAGAATIPGITSLPTADRAKVINMSLSGSFGEPCDAFSADVFEALDDAGAIVVAAAGNDAGPVNSPANCGGVIAVGASGPTGARASYSSFGPEIDIVAPGGDAGGLEDTVLSTVSVGLSSFQDGAPYGFKQGTSMAAPNVAGVVSLMLEQNSGLSRTEVEFILRQTGRACTNCQGKSLIDAAAAVAFVNGGGAVVVPSCEDTCQFNNDNECDDGRAGAISALCSPGTDCSDCDGGTPACNATNNGCQFSDDGECDDATGTGACADGTDGADCGLCAGGGGGGIPTCSAQNNGCQFNNDNECDESDGTGACADGTDSADCGRCRVGGGGGVVGGGGGGRGVPDATCNEDNNGCAYRNDGVCDEDDDGGGACASGTDSADCNTCVAGNFDAGPPGFCGAMQPTSLLGLLGALGLLRRRRRLQWR
jgi:hypothetical protein